MITGPVGGGKSTVSRRLADYLRAAEIETAVIDLDLVYCMARQEPNFADRKIWKTARRAAGTLVESFYASGLGAVIVEGGFRSSEEYGELREHVVSDVQETFVTLLVSEHGALRRAQDDPDPSRGVSRLPEVQAALYAEFRAALPYLERASKVFGADSESAEEVAKQISELVTREASA